MGCVESRGVTGTTNCLHEPADNTSPRLDYALHDGLAQGTTTTQGSEKIDGGTAGEDSRPFEWPTSNLAIGRKREKISSFSLDLLVRLAARAGLNPRLRLAA